MLDFIDTEEELLEAIESYIEENLASLNFDIACESSNPNNNEIGSIGNGANSAYKDLKSAVKNNDESAFNKAKTKLQNYADKFKSAAKNPENKKKAIKVAKIIAGIAAAILTLQTGRKIIRAVNSNKDIRNNSDFTIVTKNGREYGQKTSNTYNWKNEIIDSNEYNKVIFKSSDVLKSALKSPLSSYVSAYDDDFKKIDTFYTKTSTGKIMRPSPMLKAERGDD